MLERYTRGGGIRWKYEFTPAPVLQHLGVTMGAKDLRLTSGRLRAFTGRSERLLGYQYLQTETCRCARYSAITRPDLVAWLFAIWVMVSERNLGP